MEAEKRLKALAVSYYSRKDIQKAIFDFCQKREAIPRHLDKFGKRPDSLEYPSDIIQQVKKGFTSFHCSEELWQDPLKLSTDLTPDQLNDLREGWDLLIDIDSNYLDYSKIATELIIEALKFHDIKNFSSKFSGSKGFHILVPWKAFPQNLGSEETKNMFPEWPRIISLYLTELIKPKLIEKITGLTIKDEKNYVKDFEAPKKVMPDIILVSSRHLFRCPYSLHEKGLVSVVLKPEEIENFQPRLADPLRATVKNFYPDAETNEARELLISALDWYKEKGKKEEKGKRKYQEIKIDKSRIVLPPCIFKILNGLPDGKKRALFILINYFRSLGLNFEEIEEKVEEWNQKNKPPLREGYIKSQLSWHKRQKSVLPPNCDKAYYKDISVCKEDELCKLIKNPVNYTVRKSRIKK
jgi:hypothetical protein